jgi:hypothetical protein
MAVSILSASLEIGCPVTRVDVCNAAGRARDECVMQAETKQREKQTRQLGQDR